MAQISTYTGKYFEGQGLRRHVLRYSDLPLEALMEILFRSLPDRCAPPFDTDDAIRQRSWTGVMKKMNNNFATTYHTHSNPNELSNIHVYK
jgi:hypothetical protein